MRITFCGVGDISFVSDEQTFVGEVLLQGTSDDLTGMQKVAGCDVRLIVRVKGDSSWAFERVQTELLAEANKLIAVAHQHIAGATIESLKAFNRQIDEQEKAEREAEIASMFAPTA